MKTVCAKKVILALPPLALKRLNWDTSLKGQYYMDNIDSVIPIPVFFHQCHFQFLNMTKGQINDLYSNIVNICKI